MSEKYGLPTPPTTTSGRSRRSEQRSEDATSNRGPFGISSVYHRVGAPELRPLPLTTIYTDDATINFNRKYWIKAFDAIQGILMRHNFPKEQWTGDPEGTTVHIVHRCVPHDPDNTKRLTIYVIAPWTNNAPKDWYYAAKDLKIWADGFLDGEGEPDIDLGVEIAASELVRKKYIAPVPLREDWLSAWPQVRSKVENMLQSFSASKNNWSCIALLSFGPKTPPATNPPTVYIAMNQMCDEVSLSKAIRPAIQQFLDNTPYGWSLHMEYTISDGYSFELHPLSLPVSQDSPALIKAPYQDKVNLGANISVSDYVYSANGTKFNPLLGTMGCYIELKFDGAWHLFGLTNYHVIRPTLEGFKRTPPGERLIPASNSALYKADHEGLFPSKFRSKSLESPSRTSHNATISALDNRRRPGNEHLEKQRDQKIKFFDDNKHALGTVWAASGFARRTEANSLCDWALLSINEDRVGRNILPGLQEWGEEAYTFHLPPIFDKEINPDIAPAHDIDRQKLLFKYGAISKGTSGKHVSYNTAVHLDECHYMQDDKCPPSVESMFLSHLGTPAFGQHGDSGSIVYDPKGRGLGLLFSGTTSHTNETLVYVTPLQHIFVDIRAFLGGKVTGIRMAQLQPK